MRDIFELEPGTAILPGDAYVASYPYLLDFFGSKAEYSESDMVCGAHMVYGWMPTVLELYPDENTCDLEGGARILTRAKNGIALDASDIDALAGLVNNSLVGASKLLHFVAPHAYAIWDSKVYSFIHERQPYHYLVNSVQSYLGYLARLREQLERPGFEAFQKAMNRKIGYAVTPFRAIELCMFLNSPLSAG